MILSLLDPRVWLFVAAVGAAGYLKGCHDGKGLEKNAHAADQADANREALRLERARQSRVDESVRLAAAREAGIAAAARRAAGERDGLRDALDAARERGAQSLDACRQHAAALEDVFGQCGRQLQDLAREADGHASDSLKLQQAWPTDPPSP